MISALRGTGRYKEGARHEINGLQETKPKFIKVPERKTDTPQKTEEQVQ